MTTMNTLSPSITANDLLNRIWKSNDLPIDSVQIATELNIRVMNIGLSEDTFGVLIKKPKSNPIIALSRRVMSDQQRFSCAFELGRYIFASNQKDYKDDYTFFDYVDDLDQNKDEEDKKFSQEFAAHLLMPKDKVTSIYKKYREIVQTAKEFDVPVEEMSNRLKSLGLIK